MLDIARLIDWLGNRHTGKIIVFFAFGKAPIRAFAITRLQHLPWP
jgi:hypothetical protein